MKKYLRGLSITNYRGIGLNKQTLSHLSNINLLIGPNNSGKSSFLSFIHQNISNFNIPQNTTQNKRKNSIRKTDIHLSTSTREMIFEIGFSPQSIQKTIENIVQQINPSSRLQETTIKTALASLARDNLIWFAFYTQSHDPIINKQFSGLVNQPLASGHNALYELWRALHPNSSGGGIPAWLNGIISTLTTYNCFRLPSVAYIPAIRQIGAPNEAFEDMSGKGLIDKLAEIQNPSLEDRENLRTFNK